MKRKWPSTFETVLKPLLLSKASNKCQQCNIPNGIVIIRGKYNKQPVYQTSNGFVYDQINFKYLASLDFGSVTNFFKLVKIRLCFAPKDKDPNNFDENNLIVLCPTCSSKYSKINK